ncbi:unnamed protein product [Rhizoctonia solani]|uniref:Uncharacterized protein n=1 Tax=Rhizoctonia solani TaxID=456999 RepID=A0A8H3DJB3_9AGAM|nr:unnamed protein product [Rhizoctonia solani]CAE6533532.1 unnamed protein product [Rhizoctonia solani]
MHAMKTRSLSLKVNGPSELAPEDIDWLGQELAQLAEVLTGLGRLEEALDASQAATALYQRSLGLPTNQLGDLVPHCKCDALKPIPGQLNRSSEQGRSRSINAPAHVIAAMPPGTCLKSITSINPIGYMLKVFK